MIHNVFDNTADIWWNKKGTCSTLHKLNSLRIDFILNKENIKNKKILDIGCGGGILSESLTRHKGIITAIDKSKNLINIAKEHANKSKLIIKYYHNEIETFATSQNDKFDIITCMEVIEHINNTNSFFQICKKLLKPNGAIFLSTVNKNITTYIYIILMGEYISKIIPKKTHFYKKFLNPLKIYNLVKKNQFIIKDIKELNYNPIINHVSLSNKIKSNYILYIKNT